MIEQGYKGFIVSSGFGMFAPAKTPRPIIDRLNASVVRALADPAVRSGLSSQGAEPVGNTPEEFTAFVRSEISKWANLVKAANMRAD